MLEIVTKYQLTLTAGMVWGSFMSETVGNSGSRVPNFVLGEYDTI